MNGNVIYLVTMSKKPDVSSRQVKIASWCECYLNFCDGDSWILAFACRAMKNFPVPMMSVCDHISAYTRQASSFRAIIFPLMQMKRSVCDHIANYSNEGFLIQICVHSPWVSGILAWCLLFVKAFHFSQGACLAVYRPNLLSTDCMLSPKLVLPSTAIYSATRDERLCHPQNSIVPPRAE